METDVKAANINGAGGAPPLDNDTDPLTVCRFFRLGCCRFGTDCRFVHAVDTERNRLLPEASIPATIEGKRSEANSSSGTTKVLSATTFDPSEWINAPVFVPKSRVSYEGEEEDYLEYDDEGLDEEELTDADMEDGGGARAALSYANIVTLNNNHNGRNDGGLVDARVTGADSRLCPYFEKHGHCSIQNCLHEHGLQCDLCNRYCMHPRDAEQRRKHTAECIKQHERDMEHSFAVQRSRDKTCGICLEVIMDKRPREQRFGILPSCKHIFCLSCIRTWRKANNFENKIKRGCPTCRIPSDFVCPSYVWIESDEDKERMINDYKLACNGTDCMHFKKGTANCPFGNKCFYRHALPTGELIDVGAPSRRREPSRRRNRQVGYQLEEIFAQFLNPRRMLLDDIFAELTDDDDSDDLDELDLFDIELDFTFTGDLDMSRLIR